MSEYKLVFFVPQENAESVKEAVFAAGAGMIGEYSRCAWQVAGRGQFLGGTGSNPAIGTSGNLETVEELRVETRCPVHLAAQVIDALVAAHPYEEPAYDLYPLVGLKG